VLRVVRRRLSKALRPKFDSQDFVQAVWASFFAFQPERYTFSCPEELVSFLQGLARNKVIEAVRERLALQKYNVNRECSLSHSTIPDAERLGDSQPTPIDIAIAREEWQRLLKNQPAQYQSILHLLRNGHGRQEVAHALGVSAKTIDRIVRRLSPQLENESN
jgi:RNA polymerase sigma factor (sigma-70 family)